MQTLVYIAAAGALMVSAGVACGQDDSLSRGGLVKKTHRPVPEGAIAVTAPGNCSKPGATYMLTRDITCDRTALFLGRDVTLDLNGYTITYAAGSYEHLANGDFENDLAGWDTSAAPGARAVPCGGNWPFTGKKVCRLKKGDEIVSPYMTLPVADRSYYAMCGVLTNYAALTVSVEAEGGKAIESSFAVTEGKSTKVYKTCPTTGSTILDGGFVFAQFSGMPAGRYRVRIKAESKPVVIDGVDIRPAHDVGVAIVGKTWIYTDHKMVVVDKHFPAFVDYTVEGTSSQPIDSIASALGNTNITIKNGTIRNGFESMQSRGVQAIGVGGMVTLENLNIVSAGINTNAVLVDNAVIRNCRFETDTPFIIERHSLKNSPVAICRSAGSEVSHCEFIGGQGNLCVIGRDALVHDNLFVNRQRVVNHYALSLASARNAKVYNNRFEPDLGCGINIYRSKDCEIYQNEFTVKAVDRSCGFYNGGGTMVGVRISDYADKPNAPRGTWGNDIHDNKFRVLGKRFDTFRRRAGRACAIFSSTGAGVNHVRNNEILVEHADPESDAMAVAFYIGASPNAGIYENNRIVSNVTPTYLAVGYGDAAKCVFTNNTFVKASGANADWQPFAFGYREAKEIEFRGNTFEGCDFGIDWRHGGPDWKKGTYAVYWTLRVSVVDKSGQVAKDADVVVLDKDGAEALRGKTGPDGMFEAELLEYEAVATRPGGKLTIDRKYSSPYTVQAVGSKNVVELKRNTDLTICAQ